MSHHGFQLSEKQKLEEVVESLDRLLEEKLQTNQGLLPNPVTLRCRKLDNSIGFLMFILSRTANL